MVIVFVLAMASAGKISEAAAVTELAGCYQLKLSAWNAFVYGDAIPTRVNPMPEKVHLFAERGQNGAEKQGYVLRALPESVDGSDPPSFWQPKGDKHLELIWTDGMTFIRSVLTREKSGLNGWAEQRWTISSDRSRRRSVFATRIDCAQP